MPPICSLKDPIGASQVASPDATYPLRDHIFGLKWVECTGPTGSRHVSKIPRPTCLESVQTPPPPAQGRGGVSAPTAVSSRTPSRVTKLPERWLTSIALSLESPLPALTAFLFTRDAKRRSLSTTHMDCFQRLPQLHTQQLCGHRAVTLITNVSVTAASSSAQWP